MLNGPIWNKLPQYALPVAATGILEQLFNASDIAIVGNFTGESRTAAVVAIGANSPIIGLILNSHIDTCGSHRWSVCGNSSVQF